MADILLTLSSSSLGTLATTLRSAGVDIMRGANLVHTKTPGRKGQVIDSVHNPDKEHYNGESCCEVDPWCTKERRQTEWVSMLRGASKVSFG